MNNLLKSVLLLLVLAVVFSGLSACTSSANSDKKTGNETVQPSNETVTNETVKKDDNKYPAIPAALNSAEIKKLDDSIFKLDDKKGNVVLLNLWATWCGPCRGEMPHLNEMQDSYRNKNFEIIGLNTDDESVEDINKFVDEMKLNYTMAYADGALMKELINISKFQGIPQSFLIDREGRLRGVFLGGGSKVVNTMKQTVANVVNE
ncbi:MAG: TlpA disulfide reductase family protein [Pyrinomonadaceae bacterium]